MNSKQRLLQKFLGGLLLGILSVSYIQVVHADADDWVRVQRFKGQLKQAEAGSPQAMYEVGYMYERGRGVDANLDQARAWYEKGMQAGSGISEARLGMMYFYGRGVSENHSKAYTHIRNAAQNKVPLAQFYLGRMYELGRGVNKDLKKSLKWYTASVKNGYYDPQGRIVAVKKALEKQEYGDFPKAAAKKPESSQEKLARNLLKTVMKGDWQRSGKAASYLPSAKTTCKAKSNKIVRCQSQQITRNSGGNIITYVTVSTLSGFNSKAQQFRVAYHNNILQIRPEGEKLKYDDDEEFSAVTPNYSGLLKLGRQDTEHKLNCSLQANVHKLVCIKNRSSTLEFKDEKS